MFYILKKLFNQDNNKKELLTMKKRNKYTQINELSKRSSNLDLPLQERLDASAKLAEVVGVEDSRIIRNTEDIDAFFSK